MRINESVVINRPPDEVWAFLTDLFNSPRVRPGALALRRTSPGPLGSGSVLQGRMMILGFEARFTMTVTEFDPPRSAVVTLAARPGRGAIRTTLEPTPEGTRVDRTTDFELNPALRLMSPIFGLLLRRQDRAAARNWKRLIEGTPPSASQKP
jgi:carbon monoxide dehydrogenase subunit G